ncbi:phospholipase A2 inhibitor and Ly6/PLAUR domain-containing protein-like [Ascaphus truei]|uniref:phospholipase A2 inhibitor and Ly6/PLAUR domain-containing protein-like n=1 Tax=Ascaphus truei TaxID=8439 RepID=UPI003F5AA718
MRHLSKLLCVLLSYTATAYSLKCIQCTTVNGLNCTGNETQCTAAQDVCISAYNMEKIGSRVLASMLNRGCGSSLECSAPGTLSNEYINFVKGINCCKEDLCTPTLNVFSENKTDNGLTCPSCYTTTSNQCHDNGTMKCTGNENKCIRFYTHVTTENQTTQWAMRGCANELFCGNENIAVSVDTMKVKVDMSCSNASSGLHHTLLLLALAFLPFMRLM